MKDIREKEETGVEPPTFSLNPSMRTVQSSEVYRSWRLVGSLWTFGCWYQFSVEPSGSDQCVSTDIYWASHQTAAQRRPGWSSHSSFWTRDDESKGVLSDPLGSPWWSDKVDICWTSVSHSEPAHSPHWERFRRTRNKRDGTSWRTIQTRFHLPPYVRVHQKRPNKKPTQPLKQCSSVRGFSSSIPSPSSNFSPVWETEATTF